MKTTILPLVRKTLSVVLGLSTSVLYFKRKKGDKLEQMKLWDDYMYMQSLLIPLYNVHVHACEYMYMYTYTYMYIVIK